MAHSTHRTVTRGGASWRRYQDVMVGSRSLGRSLYFEFCTWLAPLPGALGLLLRGVFWPRLFAACGAGTQFGPCIVLRHPHRVHIGARVVVSEGCMLDARNSATANAIVIEDDVILSPQVMVQCKGAKIRIGARSGLGPQTILIANESNDLAIGADVAIGPRCTLLGGGNYHDERLNVPICSQGIKPGLPVVLEDDIWLGAAVTVLGGVRIGHSSIIGAGAVVTRDVAPFTVCAGVPARPIRRRTGTEARAGD